MEGQGGEGMEGEPGRERSRREEELLLERGECRLSEERANEWLFLLS